MLILSFRGSLQWDSNDPVNHNGIVCFCHVEVGDNIKINTIANLLSQLEIVEGGELVIVPFPFLNNKQNKMDCESAKKFLANLKEKLLTLVPKRIPVSLASGTKANVIELSVKEATFGFPDNRISFMAI